MKTPKIFRSSVNPEKLSLTIKGIGVGLIPVIILISRAGGIELGAEELTNLVVAVSASVAAFMTVYGLIRKLIVKIKRSK